ncbi:MAG: hypothetical protein WKG00_14080 [Polyangiaceae bacterium]
MTVEPGGMSETKVPPFLCLGSRVPAPRRNVKRPAAKATTVTCAPRCGDRATCTAGAQVGSGWVPSSGSKRRSSLPMRGAVGRAASQKKSSREAPLHASGPSVIDAASGAPVPCSPLAGLFRGAWLDRNQKPTPAGAAASGATHTQSARRSAAASWAAVARADQA